MADVTKLVGNRISNSRAVVAALDVQAKQGVAKLNAILFPGEAPSKLTTEEFIDRVARALERASTALSEAEQELVDEQGDDEPVRMTRDAAFAELRTELDEIADTIGGAYGAQWLTRYQLAGAFPQAPELLLSRGKAVATSLKKGAPDSAPRKGRKIDFGDLASELETKINALSDALNAVKREEKEAQQALSKRDAIIADFEPKYAGVASLATGVLELIGNRDLAERVKPTVRRRIGIEAQPTDPEQPGGLDPTAPGGPFEPENPPTP
jgi:hypothetical protein